MKVYPPYGRSIAAMIARGVKPACVGVLLSERWSYYQNVARVCIKPDDWAPRRWEFGYLRNMHVVAIWGEEVAPWQFGWLLIDLMLAEPALLWMVDASGQYIYKEDEASVVYEYATLTLAQPADSESPTAADKRETLLQWRGPRAAENRAALDSYRRGLARAAVLDQKVAGRMEAKDGDLLRWYDDGVKRRAFVEGLFSDPYAVMGERAA